LSKCQRVKQFWSGWGFTGILGWDGSGNFAWGNHVAFVKQTISS